jgi:diaminopimelate decarboxylase
VSVADEVLVQFAEQFGTPLYAYNTDMVEARLTELRRALPEGADLLYSFKANPLASLARTLRDCRAEVSSAGEVDAAEEAGFDMSRALYDGPGKSRWELEHALDAGVRVFSVESTVELTRLAESAGQRALVPRVLLRIRPSADLGAGLIVGSRTHFGFPAERIVSEIQRSKSHSERVEIIGLHVYTGTQQRDPGALAQVLRFAQEIAEQLGDVLSSDLQILDLGGGFPWPFGVPGTGPNPAQALISLRALATEQHRWLWFESGRYLVASAGTFVTRVLDVREVTARSPVVVADGGTNALGGLSGLGRIFRPDLSARILGVGKADRPIKAHDLVGPLCTPLDLLATNVHLPEPRPGDLIAVSNVGAYGLTTGLLGFLSRRMPAEVVHCGDRVVDVSRRSLVRAPLDPTR